MAFEAVTLRCANCPRGDDKSEAEHLTESATLTRLISDGNAIPLVRPVSWMYFTACVVFSFGCEFGDRKLDFEIWRHAS